MLGGEDRRDGPSQSRARTSGWVTAMEYVRRHDYLVTCGVDGTMVCRTEKGKELQRVDARGALFCLAYGARRDLLVAGGRGAISVFRLVTINTVERNKDPVDRRVHPVRLVCTVPDVHADVIRGVACDASGRIFTGSYDRSVCVFDGEQFERMRSRDADEPAASVPPRDPPRYRRWADAHDAAVSGRCPPTRPTRGSSRDPTTVRARCGRTRARGS